MSVKMSQPIEVEKQVKESGGTSWYVVVAFLVFFVPTWTNVTLNKMWYSVSTDAAWNNVSVEKEPTDCDWNHAPLGNKNCSYKKIGNYIHESLTLSEQSD